MGEEFFEKREYVLNKTFLWTSGIWPYQECTFLRRIFVVVVFVSILILQILKVLEDRERSFEVLIEILPAFITAIGAYTKYLTPVIKLSKTQLLLTAVKNNCEEFSKTPQHIIMKRYAMKGRIITIQYIGLIAALAALNALLPFEPFILDIVKLINESRERLFMYQAKFFIDERKYYVPILLYQYFICGLVLYILFSADALFLMFVQHACATFKSLGNYMKHLHTPDENWENEQENDEIVKTVNKSFTKEECKRVYLKLKYGIKIHKKIIRFCETLESTYTIPLAILLVFNVLFISSTCFQVATAGNDMTLLTKHVTYVMGELFHLFFICLPGQRLINHSENFYKHMCDVLWYEYSKETKVLYQLVTFRSTMISKLTFGKVFPLGTEMYLSIVQTAMSYFTMLMSMR